jgi:hypothetical protein
MPTEDVTKARELFALDLEEISIVDRPAVPGAKILMMKRQGDPSYAGIAKSAADIETTLGSLSGELKATDLWKSLPTSVRTDLETTLRKAHAVASTVSAIEGVQKYYDDYYGTPLTDAQKDADLLSDINWAGSMLISVKSMFDALDGRLEDNDFAKGLIGTINGSTLTSLKDVAAVMVSAIKGIEAKMAEQPADEQGETTTKADDDEPEEEVADDPTPDSEGGVTLVDILSAVTTLTTAVTSNSDRLTILEPTQTDDGVGDTPAPEVEAAPEPEVETPNEDVLPDGILTIEQVREGTALARAGHMTDEERTAFQTAVQATAEALGLDTTEVDGGDVPPVVEPQVEQPAV